MRDSLLDDADAERATPLLALLALAAAVCAALQRYGCDSSDEYLDKMIRYIDANGDGMVSLQEFADALAHKPGVVQAGERRAA